MMPSEPDKKMEELLRTYSRKRREDAGEPLEMHPATRRLLQAEAAKLRPKEEAPKRTSWNWLLLRWPRVAFALGLFAVLAFAVWNSIPNRGDSRSRSLLAKQDLEEKAAAQPSASSRDQVAPLAAAAPAADVGARFESDKDFAKHPQPAPMPSRSRQLDDLRAGEALADAQADVKLKKESEGRELRSLRATADGIKLTEAETVGEPTERRVMVKQADAGAATARHALDQPTKQLAPPTTSPAQSSVRLAVTPSTDAAKQVGGTYAAPGSPVPADAYAQVPAITQTKTLTNAVVTNAAQLYSFAAGRGLGAEPQPTTLNRSPAPSAPSPAGPAILAYDTRNNELKGNTVDFGSAKRADTGMVSLADRSQTRARGGSGFAGGAPAGAEVAQTQTLARNLSRFKRQAEPEKTTVAKAGKDSAPLSVMTTFDIEQDGDHVRVIDSDGSEYAGYFVTVDESVKTRFTETEEAYRSPVAGAEARRPTDSLSVARRYSGIVATNPITTNRLFRVNGTNRTYGQLVTIEALLSSGSAAASGVEWRRNNPTATAPSSTRLGTEPYFRSASKPASAVITASEQQEALRVVGKMRIGTSDEVKLIAVPAAK